MKKDKKSTTKRASSSASVKSKPALELKVGKDIAEKYFEGKKAAFVVIGKELSSKRSEILLDQFREKGGKALKLDLRKLFIFKQHILVNEQISSQIISKLNFIFTSKDLT